jgi:hypothetical protein
MMKNKDKAITHSRGVKGEFMLNKLHLYNPVLNTTIDIMHSLFLGVAKSLFKYWFSPEYRKAPFSLRTRQNC